MQSNVCDWVPCCSRPSQKCKNEHTNPFFGPHDTIHTFKSYPSTSLINKLSSREINLSLGLDSGGAQVSRDLLIEGSLVLFGSRAA